MAVHAGTTNISVSRTESLRTFVLVIVIICVPVITTLWAIVSTTEPDLSDLTPIRQTSGPYVLLSWFALSPDHPSRPSDTWWKETDGLTQATRYLKWNAFSPLGDWGDVAARG